MIPVHGITLITATGPNSQPVQHYSYSTTENITVNNTRQDVLDSTLLAHSFSAVIAVCSCTVPISRNWLWIKRHDDTKVFSDTVENKTCHPQLITHLNALTWTNLQHTQMITHLNTVTQTNLQHIQLITHLNTLTRTNLQMITHLNTLARTNLQHTQMITHLNTVTQTNLQHTQLITHLNTLTRTNLQHTQMITISIPWHRPTYNTSRNKNCDEIAVAISI